MASKQLEKRESIVHELLSTEKNYVNKLNLVLTHFMKPLSENADSPAPFISRANLRAIFSELTVIHGVNAVLLQALEKVVANANPTSSARVGGVFVKMGSFLRWYHSYVSNYDNAFQTLKKLKTNSAAFRNFIQTAEAKPELNYADLESLLILPIQRVPQYNLLFHDLQKTTTEAHPDYSQTQAAVALLTQIGTYVNEKKRESENIHEVISIGKTLIDFPNLAVPYRRFVRKGTLFYIPESAPSMPVMLFAFNDVLLLTQETSASNDSNKYDATKYAPGSYTVLQYAYWDRVTLVSPTDPNATSSPAGENPLGFTVRLKEGIYSLVANTPEERKEWAVLVKESIETTKRKSAEKEVALALKRKLQSLHHQTQHSHSDSVALRSLGVLAKGMLSEETSDQHSAPLLSPKDSNSSNLGAGATSLSTSTIRPRNGSASSQTLRRPGSSTYMNYQPGSSSLSYSELKDKAQEDKNRSKKARELIETEVKQVLLKDNIKDGSIDQFLSAFNIDAYYIVPIVLLTGKAQTTTPALLAISHCAFFIFVKSKMTHSAFLFDIREISSKNHPDFSIRMIDSTSYECRSQYCDDIIYQLRRAYLLTYFGIPESLAWYITTDEWRQPHIVFDDEKKISFGNFVRAYRAACAYMAIPLREDLIWDITHNPTNAIQPCEEDPHSFAELNLSFVEELTNNDLKTLMMALRFNPFFTSLVIRDVVLSRDGFSAVSEMLRYNSTLKRIVLVNNGLGKDQFATLADTFNAAPGAINRKLEVLEIRNNELDNVSFLVKHLDGQKRNVSLTTLDLSQSGLGAKAITALFSSLRKSTPVYHTLTKLALSGCRFDTESSASAAAFLATPCALQHLDVSGTQIKLTQVLEAMTRGCIYLEHLDISANKWDKRLEPVLIKFLTKTDSLRSLRVNNTGISAEALAHLIEAASTNVYVTKLRIAADENSFGSLGASLIARAMKEMQGIVELSLADNDFGDEGLSSLFQTLLVGAVSLKRLILDANFKLKTTKSRASMMKSLIKFACSKSCKLSHLSLAGTPAPATSALNHYSSFRSVGTSGKTSGAQLRTDLIPLLDCLPRVRIAELNISGHRCGPRGVIALGRALQESYHVKKIWWDENGASAESFAALVHAIKSNFSLTVCSPPLIDLSSIMTQGDPVANAKILKNIELLAMHIGENEARRKASASSAAGPAPLSALPNKMTVSTAGLLETGSPTPTVINSTAPSALSKKKSSGQMTVNIEPKKPSKTMRASTKGNVEKEGKEGHHPHKSLTQKLKLSSLAHKVKSAATGGGANSTMSSSSSSGPKSARGAVEGNRSKKPRGPSVSSSGEVSASTNTPISPRAIKPKSAASEPLEKREAPTTTSSSSSKRHLRAPSLQGSALDTIIAEAAASVTSDSAMSTSTTGGAASTLETSNSSSSSPIKTDLTVSGIVDKNDMGSKEDADDTEETYGDDIGTDDVSVLEDDEILELDDTYNDESDEDYRDNPDDEHDDDHNISETSSLAPSPAPSPRPDDAMSPTALALRNMSSPTRDLGVSPRYGRDAEDAILAATGRSPRVNDLDLNPLTASAPGRDAHESPERSPRSAPLSHSSPRASGPSSPRISTPSSPRNHLDLDNPEGLRSPVTIRLRPKLSRANSSFMRIVNAAKALPDDLDIGGGAADDGEDEDSDLELMERVEVDSDGDHFSDVLHSDDNMDDLDDSDESLDDDDDSAEEKGISYDRVFKGKSPRYNQNQSDFGAKVYQEQVTDLSTETDDSTDTNSSSMDMRPSSPRVMTNTVETIGERSREHSSAEESDDDRTQFETMPTLPTSIVSPRTVSSNRLSIERSPRGGGNISPRGGSSPRPSDAVSLASSVASLGLFEHAPTMPSMPGSSTSSSTFDNGGPTSARSDSAAANAKEAEDRDALKSSSSVPSSPVNDKKTSKTTTRKKKKR